MEPIKHTANQQAQEVIMNTKTMMWMRFFNYLLSGTLVIAFLLGGCSSLNTTGEESEEFKRRELPRQLTEQEEELVDGSGHFGLRLMQRLVEGKPAQSHFISPLSIQMAYSMTMSGAGEETYTQIKETLGFEEMSREEINRASRDLIRLLSEYDENVQFNIANSIWYRDTFSVEQSFLEVNETYYESEIEAVDFTDSETVDLINGWVGDKTNGLIKEIVQGPIDPLTVMYLINAIYFNGNWTIPFDSEITREQPFYRPGGSTVNTEMMRIERQEQMMYQRGDDYQAVNLYYGDAGFAMTLVLPDEETGVESWMRELDWDKWQKMTENFNHVTLSMDLPKFEMEYEIKNFKGMLKDMGIVDAFSPQEADFSRMNPAHDDLHISDTRHKSFIRVHEKGTEAAAATSVGMSLTSVPQAVNISFNRPFIYVIREVESGTVLFMGTMTDPSS